MENVSLTSGHLEIFRGMSGGWKKRLVETRGDRRALFDRSRRRHARPRQYRQVFVVPSPGDLPELAVVSVSSLIEVDRLDQSTVLDCYAVVRYAAGPKIPWTAGRGCISSRH